MKAWVCSLVSVMLLAGVARAGDSDGETASVPLSARDVLGASYSPFLHGPLSGGRAALLLSGGWDAALGRARAQTDGWVHVYGPLSLTLGAAYGASEEWRPSAGMAVALWQPSAQGFESHLLLQYKAEGFSEPEGELELTARAGYRWSKVSVFSEGSYGQDAEGRERDLEGAADAVLSLGNFSLGLGGRGRKAFGEKKETVLSDLIFAPHVGVVVADRHFLGLATGASVVTTDRETTAGVFGMASYAIVIQ